VISGHHDHPGSSLLIVFEGIGGSGKSTVLKTVARELTLRGYTVTTTHQPGGTAIGQKIRDITLSPQYKAELDATAQLLLYAADRYLNIKHVIQPALAAGHIVLCDRFDHSTRAYQAAGGGNPATLETINRLAVGSLRPGRTYWFDVDAPTGRERSIKAARAEADRYDQEALDFWRRLQASYTEQARRHPEEIQRIDANRPLDDVIQDTLADLLRFLGRHHRQML
jgi:dTMP kinase